MNKQVVYFISVIAILLIAHCPCLRAEGEPNSPVLIDFDDLTPDSFVIEDTFLASIANITVESQVEFPDDEDQLLYPGEYVNISDANFLGVSGYELGEIRNVNLDFDFGSAVDSLKFSFYEDGGNINLFVNGQMFNFYDFTDIDGNTIAGVAASVVSGDPNLGELTLTGTIYSFKVGGTQLRIDNLIVTPCGSTTFHVDVEGSDSNLGLSESDAFATIQNAVNFAHDNDVILLHPGIYTESICFTGKAITLTGASDSPIIQSPNENVMTFYLAETKDTIIQNLIIANSKTAILCRPGSPTIRNITVVDNDFGLSAFEGSAPDVYNCIFWDNKFGDLDGCSASYCSAKQSLVGIGNISGDPLFAQRSGIDDNATPSDPNDDFLILGDYHLMSEGWRWTGYSVHDSYWVYDAVSSRCIDAGIPSYGLHDEPLIVDIDNPNEFGLNIRVNMGAYGGTAQASMGPHGHALLSDTDNDGAVNGTDLLVLASEWLESDYYLPADLNRNGEVDLLDFSLLGLQWGKMTNWGMQIDIKDYWPLEQGAKWQSEIIDGESFTFEITGISQVNGETVWEFTNTHLIAAETFDQVEYRFFVDDVMYSVQDSNDLATLPAYSENYTPLFKESMDSGIPCSVEGSVDLTPIRGSLTSVLQNSAMFVEDFPGGGNYDVFALFEDYRQPDEKIVAIFARGVGPLYIKADDTKGPIIMGRVIFDE